MQKCPSFHVKYSSMDQYIVKTFTKRLENLSISDYYGLNGPGLTCYLNSILQVLFMTENFRETVKSEHSTSLDQHLGDLFRILERNRAKTHSITIQLEINDVYEQRDAAEYFEKILCRTGQKASEVFKGELNHETRCNSCKKTAESKNVFWVLPLPMNNSNHKPFNLQQGLEDFFKVQKVNKENQMFCNNCNKKQDADIKFKMTLCPEVLTLLLKRFTFDYRLNCFNKLHSRAEVVQTLNIENCRYDLYAVVNHYGSLTGGHYTADIKSFETGCWYHFNDNVVKSVKDYFESGKNSISSKTAYLLMYRKVGGQTIHSNGSDLEAQGGRSDIETEDRRDETETGNALASDHLRTDSCRGRDYKYRNGDMFTDDASKRQQVNSQEKLNKGANQRAGVVRQQEDVSHQRHADADRQQQDHRLNIEKTLDPHLGTNSSHWTPDIRNYFSVKGQKVNKITNKQDAIEKSGTKPNVPDRSSSRNRIEHAQTKAVSHQKEAAGIHEQNMNLSKDTCVSDVGQSNVRIRDVYSPLASSSFRCSSSPSRENKPSKCNGSPCGCRKHNSFKNNKEKIKSVVSLDSRYEPPKHVTRRDKTVSPHEAKNVQKSETNETKKPWK